VSEWNYNLEEAPMGKYILLSCDFGGRRVVVEGRKAPGECPFLDTEGAQIPQAYAWMPLPDPAAMPEVTA
jgi:hypothetical protein